MVGVVVVTAVRGGGVMEPLQCPLDWHVRVARFLVVTSSHIPFITTISLGKKRIWNEVMS